MEIPRNFLILKIRTVFQTKKTSRLKNFLFAFGGLICAAVTFLALIIGFCSIESISSGHVGVMTLFGAVQENHLPEGLHTKNPLSRVHEVDVRLTSVNYESMASSRDLQIVTTEVSVQYFLNPALVPKIYKNVGNRDKIEQTIISPAIKESVKQVTAQYKAEELITKRTEAKQKISSTIATFIGQTLSSKLKLPKQSSSTRGVLKVTGIEISNVAITEFRFSEEFNKAIEMKVKAQQEALQAKNEKEKIITQAEADKAKQQLAADASAYQTLKEAEARSKAIKLEADALRNNPELIKLRLAEAWDGVLPKFTGGGAIHG